MGAWGICQAAALDSVITAHTLPRWQAQHTWLSHAEVGEADAQHAHGQVAEACNMRMRHQLGPQLCCATTVTVMGGLV